MKTLIAMLLVLVGVSAEAQTAIERMGGILGPQPRKATQNEKFQQKMREKQAMAATNAPSVIRTNMALPPENFGSQAYYAGRAACKAALKSPSSAKFSNPNTDSATGWEPFGYYQWKVGGQVEASNALGVSIKQDWLAVVQYNVGKFQVVYLRLGSDESGTMPGMRKAP